MPDPQRQRPLLSDLWPLTGPMALTLLRLVLLPVFLWFLVAHAARGADFDASRRWALAVFAVMAVTDKLDGTLARRLNQTSALGTILDPLADKLLVGCSVLLLAFAAVAGPAYRIPAPVVAAVYAKDVLLVVGAAAVVTAVRRLAVAPRPLGKLSTFLQLLLVILTLAAPDLDRLRPGTGRSLLPILWWSVSLVSIAACAEYLKIGFRQYRDARATVATPGESAGA